MAFGRDGETVQDADRNGQVVISGGCFQNKRLTEQLQRMFAEAGIPLFVPGHIPVMTEVWRSGNWQ